MGMGDVLSQITGAISTGTDIVSDPYFPEIVCRMGQIRQSEKGQPMTVCQTTIDGLPSSGNLSKYLPPLRAYVYAEQNKWVFPLAAFAVIGVPFFLGYMTGKG